MPITYKTILAEAVRGYNKIQNALNINKDVTKVDVNAGIKALTQAGSTIGNLNTADQMVDAIEILTTKGTCTVSGGELVKGNGSATATGNISLTSKTSQPSGYYIKVEGSGEVSRSAISISHTAGYFASETSSKSALSTISSNIKTQYYQIPTSTCTTTNIVTETANNSGISIVYSTGYTEGSSLYIKEVTVDSGKEFVVNNKAETTVNVFVEGANTKDYEILIENNSFDVKDTNNVSLFDLIDAKLTSIENILNTPAGTENAIVTAVNQQTDIIDDINNLLS